MIEEVQCARIANFKNYTFFGISDSGTQCWGSKQLDQHKLIQAENCEVISGSEIGGMDKISIHMIE